MLPLAVREHTQNDRDHFIDRYTSAHVAFVSPQIKLDLIHTPKHPKLNTTFHLIIAPGIDYGLEISRGNSPGFGDSCASFHPSAQDRIES